MKIHVICGEFDSVISGMAEEMTIQDIWRVLQHDLLVPVEKRFLVYKGRLLTADLTLKDCDIEDGGMLFLVSQHDLSAIDDLRRQEDIIRSIQEEFTDLYGVPLENLDDDCLVENVDRVVDMSLIHCEALRTGHIEMLRMYHELEKLEETVLPQIPTVLSAKLDAPSTEPLPLLWFEEECP